MSDRSRTISLRKQQILEKIQYNFQKIDPAFQVKYFIGENSNLVEYQMNKWNRQSRQKTVYEQQIERAIKTLRHPFTLESYVDKPQFITPSSDKNHKEIKQNEEKTQIAKSPIKEETLTRNCIATPSSPLKKLFTQYQDLVKVQYITSSEQMKKLIQQYSDSEKPYSSSRNPEFTPSRQINLKRKKKGTNQFSLIPPSPIPRNREHLLQKNTNNLILLDELQDDLESFRKSLGEMQKFKNLFPKRQQKKSKYDFLF
ncbi:unnamed protein product [Paramecium primaurelia]|uniref:Uncharacterized protein n=1 Tax=Paramecium primaurelia TaxID=5886 RepID=A0A8S1KHQ6_PARPR|nr:unnamed protein product [Paramecium primaurelia]